MKDCPPRLYKYRDLCGAGLGYVERTILHNEIYLASPVSFNDPFDCLPDFDLRSSVEDRVAMNERALIRLKPHLSPEERAAEARHWAENPVVDLDGDDARLTMQEMHDKHVREQIGVYCVCECADSLLRWSHYGGSHSGACFEFDSIVMPFNIAQDVDYSPSRDPVRRATETEERSIQKALLTKFEGWRYEHEWRVVEYEQGPGTYEIPSQALTGIVLGARISVAHESQLLRWVAARSPAIRVLRAVPSTSEFKLELHQVG